MIEKLRGIACVLWGHPPIVNYCMGYVTCARCDEQLGDTLGSVYPMAGLIIRTPHQNTDTGRWETGQTCPECIAFPRRWRDRFLTPGDNPRDIELCRKWGTKTQEELMQESMAAMHDDLERSIQAIPIMKEDR